MDTPVPNYRVARGVVAARELLFSSFTEPGPKPNLAYGIADMDALERVFLEFNVDYGNPARIAAKIPSRFLYTSLKGPIYGRSDQRLQRESRYLPPEQMRGCADLSIVGNTVVFMTIAGTDVAAQAITDAALARQMISIFNFMWERAAP